MRSKSLIIVGLLSILITPLYITPLYAHTCNPLLTPKNPDSRYEMFDNGTVRDRQTGLVWMRCLLGQGWNGKSCDPVTDWHVMTSRDEIDKTLAGGFRFAGAADWRLPTIFELESIVESACQQPSINRRAFPNASLWHVWSSTPYGDNHDYAWAINFKDGSESSALSDMPSYHVRLVRGKKFRPKTAH